MTESFTFTYRNKEGENVESVYTVGLNAMGLQRTKEQVIEDWKIKLANGNFDNGDYVVISADGIDFDLRDWFRNRLEDLYRKIDKLEEEIQRRGIEL